MPILLLLKSKLGGYLAAAGGVILLIGAAVLKGMAMARNKIKADTVDEIIKVSKKEKEIDKDIKSSSSASKRDKLRKYVSDPE